MLSIWGSKPYVKVGLRTARPAAPKTHSDLKSALSDPAFVKKLIRVLNERGGAMPTEEVEKLL